jgi:hypothetical protein
MKVSDTSDFHVEKRAHYKQIEHLQNPPWGEVGRSARQVALAYLQLGPIREALELEVPPALPDSDTPPDNGWGALARSKAPWRWLPDRTISRDGKLETVVVTLQQRVLTDEHGLDLWGGGIAITLHRSDSDRFGVAGATTTALSNTSLRSELGAFVDRSLDRKDAERQSRDLVLHLLGGNRDTHLHDLRPVAFPVDGDLRPAILTFASEADGGRTPGAHRVIVDWEANQILMKRPKAAAAAAPVATSGQVFPFDPVTAGGDVAIGPHRKGVHLDAFGATGQLLDLTKQGGKYHLKGPRIQIASPNPLGEEPPTSTSDFDFSCRTNEFAAVNAYYHCDAMMRMVKGFGFDLGDYFANVELPLTVVHRAKLPSGSAFYDGIGINAFVIPELLPGGPPSWRVKMLFGLADFSDLQAPIGLAADPRWLWHEFCHVLLLASTGKTEFDFAHSAGDALAAIMSDPESRLAAGYVKHRGVTFPFAGAPIRRHDRCVSCGWGWNGHLYDRPAPTYSAGDPAGYRAEQILSSTLFRLYRAIGGEEVEARRWSAAHYVAYLIVRAIGQLGPADTVPSSDAAIFAAALRQADAGTGNFVFKSAEYGGLSHRTVRVGGAVHKVIRWAFEQHGLYQTASDVPQNRPGEPPSVDIFLNDRAGRQGGYEPTTEWDAADDTLWIRHAPDNGVVGETPRAGRKNYVYINVRNRGSDAAAAPSVSVDVLAAKGSDIRTWVQPAPAKWAVLAGAPGAVTNATVQSGQTVRFGPFVWKPEAGRHALMVRASAAGDRSNADAGSPLACAAGPIPVRDLVPCDNNLAYRAWNIRERRP